MNIRPSHLSSKYLFLPVKMAINKNNEDMMATNKLVFSAELNGNGLMVELTPSTKKILKIFEPTMLPTAKSVFFLYAANAEVANSGNDVPTATTVNPIIDWLAPNASDIFMAPFTIHCPPKNSPTKPKEI